MNIIFDVNKYNHSIILVNMSSNTKAREAQREINQIRSSSEYRRLVGRAGYSRRREVLEARIATLQKSVNHQVPVAKAKVVPPKVSASQAKIDQQRRDHRAAAAKAAVQRRDIARKRNQAKRNVAVAPKKTAPVRRVVEPEPLDNFDLDDELSTDVEDVEDLVDIENDLPEGRETQESLADLEDELDDLEIEDDFE